MIKNMTVSNSPPLQLMEKPTLFTDALELGNVDFLEHQAFISSHEFDTIPKNSTSQIHSIVIP